MEKSKSRKLSGVAGSSSKVSRDDFKILTVLGKGAYGRVYQVEKTRGSDRGEIYAMKSVNKSRIIDSKTDVRHTRTERDVLVRVDHPFLIKMLYAFETENRLYFVQVSSPSLVISSGKIPPSIIVFNLFRRNFVREVSCSVSWRTSA